MTKSLLDFPYLARSGMKHYFLVFWKILSGRFPYSKFLLLLDYATVLARSIAFYKSSDRKKQREIKNVRFLRYQISFINFGELLNLLEEIFVEQVYATSLQEDKPTIVDCGSNIGISVLYLKMVYPMASIVAIEPDPVTFKILRQNVIDNALTNVQLFQVALSDSNGVLKLYQTADHGSLQRSVIESEERPWSMEVPARRLSELIKLPAHLIKIDVEGSEVMILQELIQAEKLSGVQNLVIEFHPSLTDLSREDWESLLRKNGFDCRWFASVLFPNSKDCVIHCWRLQ